MEKMTITEALSEINLLKKKVQAKEKAVSGLLVSAEHVKDPYADEGGTAKFLEKEFQSIGDFRRRLIKIRSAISKANLENEITLAETTMSIQDWLTWKREVAKEETSLINTVCSTVKRFLDESTNKPQCYQDSEGKPQLLKLKSNVDYAAFVRKQEKMTELFENLDGKLSLKNATIVVSI